MRVGMIERPVEDDLREKTYGFRRSCFAEQIERGFGHRGIVMQGKEAMKGWLHVP